MWRTMRILVEVLLLAISVWLGYDKFIQDTKTIYISWDFGDHRNSVELTVSQSNVEFNAVMDSIWSDENSKAVALQWLRGKDFFHFQDRELADFLSKRMAKTPSDGAGETTEQRMYRLNESLNDNPLIRELRNLAQSYKPPFQHIGKKVRVGVPSGKQPRDSTVYVSFGSEFMGRSVEILNLKNQKNMVFRARGAFDDTEAIQIDFQMNSSQAIYLFEHVPFTAEAVATVLPSRPE